jgi:DNA-binding MarR family transcriptional regulator
VTDELDEDELGAYFGLIAAGDLLQRAVAAQLAEHGMTPLQFTILATLLNSSAGLRMSELADVLVLSRSGLTYQVTQLEKAGLVRRAATSDDERGVLAMLTPMGRDRALEAFPGHVELVRAKFLDLLQPGEIDTIREALDRVVTALRSSKA